jgi:hypothetical protein
MRLVQIGDMESLFVVPDDWTRLHGVFEKALGATHPVLVKLRGAGNYTIAHRLAMLSTLAVGEQRIQAGEAPFIAPDALVARIIDNHRLTTKGFLQKLRENGDETVRDLVAVFILQSSWEAARIARDRFSIRAGDVEALNDLAQSLVVKCFPSSAHRKDAAAGYLSVYEPKASFVAFLAARARPKELQVDDQHALRVHANDVEARDEVPLEALTPRMEVAYPPDDPQEDRDPGDAVDPVSLTTLRSAVEQMKVAPKHLDKHLRGSCRPGGKQCRQVEEWLAVLRAALNAQSDRKAE